MISHWYPYTLQVRLQSTKWANDWLGSVQYMKQYIPPKLYPWTEDNWESVFANAAKKITCKSDINQYPLQFGVVWVFSIGAFLSLSRPFKIDTLQVVGIYFNIIIWQSIIGCWKMTILRRKWWREIPLWGGERTSIMKC